jgi:hypothetical protein
MCELRKLTEYTGTAEIACDEGALGPKCKSTRKASRVLSPRRRWRLQGVEEGAFRHHIRGRRATAVRLSPRPLGGHHCCTMR